MSYLKQEFMTYMSNEKKNVNPGVYCNGLDNIEKILLVDIDAEYSVDCGQSLYNRLQELRKTPELIGKNEVTIRQYASRLKQYIEFRKWKENLTLGIMGAEAECAVVVDEDDYWPSVEEYDPGITKEEWKKYILEVEMPEHPMPMKMLVGIMALGGKASCKQLAEVYGGTPNAYVGCTMNLGRRVKKYFNKPGCIEEGKERVFVYMFQGRHVNDVSGGYYEYKIRPELEAALKELDLSGYSPYYDEKVEMGNIKMEAVTKNTILYGPPGTGKTYSSAIYAVAICDSMSIDDVKAMDYSEVMSRYKKLTAEGRIVFTTFHQSYGYEEFIEGIKPVIGENDGIGYRIEDGVFKKFCQSAKLPEIDIMSPGAKVWKVIVRVGNNLGINTIKSAGWHNNKIMVDWSEGDYKDSTNVDNQIKRFREQVEIGDIIVTYAGNSANIDSIGIITGDAVCDDTNKRWAWSREVEWLEHGVVRNIKELNGGKFFGNDTLQELKRVNVADLLKMVLPQTIVPAEKNCVFIIDEINRGNISKIFGELITLIEDTKRAGMPEEMSAVLPYSGTSFSVPKNVYILGTMNTADRSIALMDTALRRRFQFVAMMPDADVLRNIGADTVDGLDVASMLEKINERITFLYDREHTIGHAFFTKLVKDPTVNTLRSIFEKSVIPLLQEYFYEDYQKIQLVLGDNGKSEDSYKFILDKDVKTKDIFKGSVDDVLDLPEKRYKINPEAFSNIESYKQIL